MAVQTTENAAGANPASVNFPQNVNEGTDGKGLHIDGIHGNDPNSGAGLSADLTRAAVPGLLKDDYDTDIVKMAWASTPINAMMRDMGYKKTESTVFKFYSVDMRVTEDLLTASKSLTAAQVGRNIPARVELTVANAYHFQVTDEIVFDGVNGYTADGVETPYVYLTAIVREIKGENTITAQFLNANPSGQTIPANTPISILCHAAAEEDGSVTPIAALPEPTELFAQKFMVQTQVSDVYERSAKEVTWNKSDQDEMAVQALMEDIERALYDIKDVDHSLYKSKSGLTEEIIRDISKRKNDPDWMLQFRLKSLAVYNSLSLPAWGPDISELDMDEIVTYVQPDAKLTGDWQQVPEDIKDTFDRLGIPEAEQKSLGGVGAQYDSEVVYHSIQEDLVKQGVIYTDMETALREHEEIVKEYFMTLVPPKDHKFAALHGAVWSGGSFVYVPEGVQVEIPLQSYFRLNAAGAGQFEHTLIIVEKGAGLHFIEGCSAPRHNVTNLHAGCVELFVKEGARLRYSTIENWSRNMMNLNTKRALVEKDGLIEWVSGSFGSPISCLSIPAACSTGRTRAASSRE